MGELTDIEKKYVELTVRIQAIEKRQIEQDRDIAGLAFWLKKLMGDDSKPVTAFKCSLCGAEFKGGSFRAGDVCVDCPGILQTVK